MKGDADPLLNFAQFGTHVLAQLEVKRRQRLVQEQHVRFGTQRAGNRHPLPLAA